MERRISATDLARNLGDVLGRIRYRNETFTIERNGTPVARITPVRERRMATLGEMLTTWKAAVGSDPTLADDLERVRAADLPPGDPWAS